MNEIEIDINCNDEYFIESFIYCKQLLCNLVFISITHVFYMEYLYTH